MDSDAKTLINDIIDAIRVGDFKRVKKLREKYPKLRKKLEASSELSYSPADVIDMKSKIRNAYDRYAQLMESGNDLGAEGELNYIRGLEISLSGLEN